MNLKELNDGSINGVSRYLEVAIPLTAATVWIVIALQSKWHLNNAANGGQGGNVTSLWGQLWWPLTSMTSLIMGPEQRKKAGRMSEWRKKGEGRT